MSFEAILWSAVKGIVFFQMVVQSTKDVYFFQFLRSTPATPSLLVLRPPRQLAGPPEVPRPPSRPRLLLRPRERPRPLIPPPGAAAVLGLCLTRLAAAAAATATTAE